MKPYKINTVLEAGGLVRKTTGSGTQIAVVHRRRYKDWVLPKGHVESNESWEQAAVREVLEETGCKARIHEIAAPVSYLTDSLLKVVIFFHMNIEEEGLRRSDEVDEVRWLTPRDAVSLLTYVEQRDLVERSFAESDPPLRRPWPLRWFVGSRIVRHERLEASLSAYTRELGARIIRRGEGDWGGPASDMLRRARRALEQGEDEKSWRTFHAARRLAIFGMEDEELRAEAQAIYAEAKEKLNNWRKEAVMQALGSISDQSQPPPPSLIYHARAILDEHFDNIYHKLALLASRLAIITILLGTAIAALFLVVALNLPNADPATALGDWRRLSVIIALGALGAMLSATLTAIREGGRIPQVIRHEVEASIRPLVGAAGAVIVVIVLESGITGVPILPGVHAYPVAIAAGFTERLVTRVLKGIESAAEH